ncbi:hypothetical protein PSHT_06741 [Puccinia striiformis]|uniref:Uncharacterized protein n=1 Tax=Puccinia striiformis TaxID=27350 RepID=A0A2S4W3N4_9BASI|nr:hypothetical protein PSHT_06741 [Puccinia striiformis]
MQMVHLAQWWSGCDMGTPDCGRSKFATTKIAKMDPEDPGKKFGALHGLILRAPVVCPTQLVNGQDFGQVVKIKCKASFKFQMRHR